MTGSGTTTIFYDGACPLCRAEIAHYQRLKASTPLRWIDVASTNPDLPQSLDCQEAMERFHVLDTGGRLISGAEAFVTLWRQLPGWRWLAQAARIPGITALLAIGYRIALPLRPRIARLVIRDGRG